MDRLTGTSYTIDASVIGNQQLFELDVTDNGEPGGNSSAAPDVYALRVYTSSGPFVTVGTPAYPNPAGSISGGNIQVRP